MSTLTTLVNNYDLIYQHRLEIMAYAPYRFSKVTFPRPRIDTGYNGYNNLTSIFGSHLGSYLLVWEGFEKKFPGSDIIPLRGVGSPFSGYVNEFVGYARNCREIVREKPAGFTTRDMLHYVGRFREIFPRHELAVPISQVVKELKKGGEMKSRPSFRLLTLREDFCRTLSTVSGIESNGPTRISYNLFQDDMYRPVVHVEAIIEIELTHDERRRSALNGSAVYVADLVRDGKEKLRELGDQYGFIAGAPTQAYNSIASMEFDLTLPDYDTVLLTETIQHISHFIQDLKKGINRF